MSNLVGFFFTDEHVMCPKQRKKQLTTDLQQTAIKCWFEQAGKEAEQSEVKEGTKELRVW